LAWTWLLSIIDSQRKGIFKKDLPLFLELLSPKKSDVILDVGAGLGTIANLLTEYSDEVFALEPNEGRVEYIKAKHPSVKAFSATANQIPFPTNYFDKLYVTMAFHHFPDQGDALEEFRRVIKKEGLLLIYEIDPSRGNGKRLKFFERKVIKNKVTFLSPQELKDLVTSHEFKTLEGKNAKRGYLFLAQNEKTGDEARGWIDYDSTQFSPAERLRE
jgi:ubiquinone/menaquinone biosynthesis C-methylase UbiE